MSRRLSLLLLPFVAACASTAQQAPAPANSYQLVSYLPNWQSDEARARAADVLHELDVGVYSFIEVKPDGTGFVADASKPVAQTWKQAFAKARKANPKLACQWAIGGWTGSRNIAKVAQTEAGRAKLASTSVAIMREYDCQ
ncbi:MAG TPA: glycosyl hydrolase family 18 protein, partial [Chitinolyticbacter sp.]|nr:glycosyl hydrolase family 18 protein [Chitinolyticbacter sp.]